MTNLKREKVIQFLKQKAYDETYPTRTIAKQIMELFPGLFDTLDSCRTCIRSVRGNNGKKRIKYSDPELLRENRTPEQVLKEFGLICKDFGNTDFVFPYYKPVILSDIHFPHHDLQSLVLALNKAKDSACDSIYLNGDILDCYLISNFLKEGGNMTFNEEREMFWRFIDWIQDEFQLPVFFKAGNHEERWEHYILRNAPEAQYMPEFSLESVLKLKELGIPYIKGRQICKMGKLNVIHGHEFGESVFSPVNPARGLFLRAKTSTLCGHNHQTSEHHENNLNGDSMACFTTGALSQLNPKWRPFAFTKWNIGFAIVTIENTGGFSVDNYRIIDGKIR